MFAYANENLYHIEIASFYDYIEFTKGKYIELSLAQHIDNMLNGKQK